jgi:hypothetical protein
MESEIKLLYSQQPNTGSYPDIQCFYNAFITDQFQYYTSSDVQLSYVYLPLRIKEWKLARIFIYPHAPPLFHAPFFWYAFDKFTNYKGYPYGSVCRLL